MKYGNVALSYRPGSLVYTPTKLQHINHYPGSNKSAKVDIGKPATRIMCELIARTEEQRDLIEQLLCGEQVATLTIGNRYYKSVCTGDAPQSRQINFSTWSFNAEFIALDPVPYSVTTDEPLW